MIQLPGEDQKFPGKREVNFSPKSRVPGAATLILMQVILINVLQQQQLMYIFLYNNNKSKNYIWDEKLLTNAKTFSKKNNVNFDISYTINVMSFHKFAF